MKYFDDNINRKDYIEFSKKNSKVTLKDQEDNEEKESQNEDVSDIKQMGVPNMPQQ